MWEVGGSETKKRVWLAQRVVGVQQQKMNSRCQLTRLFQEGRLVGRKAGREWTARGRIGQGPDR